MDKKHFFTARLTRKRSIIILAIMNPVHPKNILLNSIYIYIIFCYV